LLFQPAKTSNKSSEILTKNFWGTVGFLSKFPFESGFLYSKKGMKLFPVVSGILNLGLIGLVVWLVQDRRAGAIKNLADQHEPSQNAAATEPLNPGQPFDWRVVESEDYKKYIANLRSIGCPEETIRDIIIADVNKLFEDRRKSSERLESPRYEYWKSGSHPTAPAFGEAKLKQARELAGEKRALLKELIGVEPAEKLALLELMDPREFLLDFLPQARRTQVIELEKLFTARSINAAASRRRGIDWQKESATMEKEKEIELARLLSPEELEDYQLRRSSTAWTLRTQLEAFEPDEREFREIFKIRKHLEEEFPSTRMDGLSNAASEQMKEHLKALLGESRYAEYERSQDNNFQIIYQEAVQNGLDQEAANKIYDLKKAAEQEARTVRADDSLTKEQRAAALQEIRTEAEKVVRTMFDGDSFHTLQGRTGYWLDTLR
jgi:hypothetical protein